VMLPLLQNHFLLPSVLLLLLPLPVQLQES
jgi:hypothetical protein